MMAVAGLQMMAPFVKNFVLKSEGPKIQTFSLIEMPTHKQYEHWSVTGAIVSKVVDSEHRADPLADAKNAGKKRPSTASTPKAPAPKKPKTPTTPQPPAGVTDGKKEDEEEEEEEEDEEEADDDEADEVDGDLAADFDQYMNKTAADGTTPKPKPKPKPKHKGKKKPTVA
jgi:hypothetical protein